MFYVTLNKRNPVTFPNTPQHARAHYCSTERHTRSFSKTLLALVAADTQGQTKFLLQHYISLLVLSSCTNQVLASTLHQPFGLVSTPSFFAVHYLDRSRSPTMVTILLVILRLASFVVTQARPIFDGGRLSIVDSTQSEPATDVRRTDRASKHA